MPYNFTAKQPPNSIKCGGYALAALLGQHDWQPGNILQTLEDQNKPGSFNKAFDAELNAGESLYTNVVEPSLNQFSSPKKIVDVASWFGLNLTLKIDSAVVEQFRGILQSKATEIGPCQPAPYTFNNRAQLVVINLPMKVTVLWESFHVVCRRNDGSYFDPGENNGKPNLWGNPVPGKTIPGTNSTWTGIWIDS